MVLNIKFPNVHTKDALPHSQNVACFSFPRRETTCARTHPATRNGAEDVERG